MRSSLLLSVLFFNTQPLVPKLSKTVPPKMPALRRTDSAFNRPRGVRAIAPEDEDTLLLRKKRVCEKFLAAYRGRYKTYLEANTPSNNEYQLFLKQQCSILLSTDKPGRGQTSQLLIPTNSETIRYRCNPFSQDSSIGIYLGEKRYNARNKLDEISTFATLEIRADQLKGSIIRRWVPEITPTAFHSTLDRLVGPISNADTETASAFEPVKNVFVENAVEFMVFRVEKGSL